MIALSEARPTRRAATTPSSDAGRQRDDQRRAGQEQCRRQALQDQVEHRALLAIAEAEIEAQHALDVEPELLGQRAVEAEALAQLLQEDGVARAGLASHDLGGIARREAQQEEVQRGDGDQDDRRPQRLAKQKQCERHAPLRAPAAGRGVPLRRRSAGFRQAFQASWKASFMPVAVLIRLLKLLR
jgi:hypothetical protein